MLANVSTFNLVITPHHLLSNESHQTQKDLGVNVQSTFSWTPHIDLICKKAYCSLSLIGRNTQVHHNQSTKRKLYISLVRSNPLLKLRKFRDVLQNSSSAEIPLTTSPGSCKLTSYLLCTGSNYKTFCLH